MLFASILLTINYIHFYQYITNLNYKCIFLIYNTLDINLELI